jgi:very-short-patch-repair endonuclease
VRENFGHRPRPARKLRREMTSAERKLRRALRAHRLAGLQFRRQVPCGPYIVDFLRHSARLVVEGGGATHSTDGEIAHDIRRDAWFAANGFRVLRFTNAEVYENFEGVLETILARIEEWGIAPSSPPPLTRERGADSGCCKKLRAKPILRVPSPNPKSAVADFGIHAQVGSIRLAKRGRGREGAVQRPNCPTSTLNAPEYS